MSDLLALRARLESLGRTVVPRERAPQATARLPNNCCFEETPYGGVAVRRESVVDQDGIYRPVALGRCLGITEFDLDRPVFLDIETTGLAGGTGTIPFLVGLAWHEGAGLRLAQFFLCDLNQERALLWAIGEELRGHRVLVTYNGRAFDWPLLQTRLIMVRCPSSWPAFPHLDLLHLVRRLFHRRLPDCALKTVEQAVLGIERADDLPGYLVPTRYFAWLRGGGPDGLDAVFQHNRHDVLTLSLLMQRLELVLRDGSDLRALDRFSRARFLEAQGFEGEALREYQWLWSHGFSAPRGGLGLRLARLLRRSGQWQEARAVLEECWATQCYPYPAAIELAKILEHQARDLSAARRLVAEALTLLAAAVVGDERWRQDLERRRSRLDQRVGAGAPTLGFTG